MTTIQRKRIKYTIQDVKNSFEKENYKVLSIEYKYKEKIKFICPNNHEDEIRYNAFLFGKRCKKCGNINIGKKKMIKIEDIKERLSKYNFTVLSDYDEEKKFEYKCPQGHKMKTTYATFYGRKNKCLDCKINRYEKYDYEKVKKIFSDTGYTLTSTNYINAATDLNYICNNGCENKITLNRLQIGQRCNKCTNSTKNTYTYNSVNILFTQLNFILYLDCNIDKNIVININTTLVNYKCPLNHDNNNILLRNWLRSEHKCKICNINEKKTRNNFSIEFIREEFNKKDFKLIDESQYITNLSELDIECYKYHKTKLSFSDFYYKGYGCKKCTQSKLDANTNMILKTIPNITVEKQKKYDDCIDTKCLPFDFCINNKFLIECDGIQHFKPVKYFGGVVRHEIQNKHDKIKNEYCCKNKIPLLRISYKDIKDIEKIIKKFIINLDIMKKDVPIYWSDEELYSKMINELK